MVKLPLDFRAAAELNISTVAIYSNEDKSSLHRYKADESYLVGSDLGPAESYLNIERIIEVAKRRCRCDSPWVWFSK